MMEEQLKLNKWFALTFAVLGLSVLTLAGVVFLQQRELRDVWHILDQQLQIDQKLYNDIEELKAGNEIRIKINPGKPGVVGYVH